jgi:hypothetical protein
VKTKLEMASLNLDEQKFRHSVKKAVAEAGSYVPPEVFKV